MSTKHVILTDDEMRVLRAHAPASVELGEWGRLIGPAVESILAARERALREEIAGQIEAARDAERVGIVPMVTFGGGEPFWLNDQPYDKAAHIARGED